MAAAPPELLSSGPQQRGSGVHGRHTSPPASEIAGTGPSDTAGGWEEAIQSYEHSAQCVKSYPLHTKTNGFARMLVRMLVAFLKEKNLLSFKKQQAFQQTFLQNHGFR